jgi:hypothetical protein
MSNYFFTHLCFHSSRCYSSSRRKILLTADSLRAYVLVLACVRVFQRIRTVAATGGTVTHRRASQETIAYYHHPCYGMFLIPTASTQLLTATTGYYAPDDNPITDDGKRCRSRQFAYEFGRCKVRNGGRMTRTGVDLLERSSLNLNKVHTSSSTTTTTMTVVPAIECPLTLQPHSICQIAECYSNAIAK